MGTNPFDDDIDATRMVPGGRRPPPAPAQPSRPGPQPTDASTGDLSALATLNPLVSCAHVLLSTVPRIRTTVAHPNPRMLRDNLLQEISRFESLAKARGIPAESVVASRYALCTLIDETVATMPWGGTAEWAQASLLVTLHGEAIGGEKFFQLLNRLAENPGKNVDLLELLYVCLALGFEGRFRILPNGRAQLDATREKLAEILRKTRGNPERELSTQWRGVSVSQRRASGYLMIWSVSAVVVLLLTALFVGLDFSLNDISDRLAYGTIRTPSPPRMVKVESKPAPVPPRLRQFLAREIAEGLVEVYDDSSSSKVVIQGDGLFDSGSATIRAEFVPLIGRIAQALNGVTGPVLITGHTDDVKIRTVSFPSNWHLSQARADSVKRMIAAIVEPSRLAAEGRADQEPLARNDSPENRAKNRRVEIVVRITS